MRITHAGEGDFRYLFTDELHAKSFIADLEQALAGGQIISKSVAVLASAFTAPAAGGTATLVVRDLPSAPDMACFVSGDIVRLRQFSRAAGSLTIADCWGVVTGYVDNADGTQSWTFTRSSAPNAGAMTAGTVIPPDAIVLDYGTTGNGFYEVNAVDGAYGLNSPYAQIVSWAGHPATGQTVRSRLGNLRGIFGAANEYGLYAGAGTSVNDAYLRISNTEVGLYNLPLRMYLGGTERVHIAAHNDVWIGPSSADKRLSWDGSTLTINGSINVTGGNAATLNNVTGAINLVANASFEADTNSDGLADGFEIYNGDGSSVPTTASRVAGSKSTWAQRISWTGTNATTKGIHFNTGTRRANTDYVITFWARTNTAVDLGINHNVPPASQVYLIWPTAGADWQFYAARLQWSSANSDSWHLSIAWSAAITNGWIEFDNVQVIEGSEIVPWAVAPADKANTSLDNSVLSTLISGANIRVGSGVKDSTLNGWNIDATEIVGQAAGVDQVVLNTSGQIVAGAGAVRLDISGIGNEVGTDYGTNSAYNFLSGGAVIGGMWAQNNAFGSLDVLIGANLVDPNSIWSYAVPNRTSGITLRSTAAAAIGYSANVVLEARNAYTSSVVSMAIQNSPSTGALINFSHTPTVGASMYNVWHSGNDGAGSGLDADLLDGNHASAFGALASVNTWTQNNYFNANVGIGTTAPGDMLEIRSGDLGLNFNANYQGASYIYAYNRATYAHSPLSFLASSYSFGNGYVGIGTASPAALCDVNGRILAVTVGYDWSELTPQNGWSNYGGGTATLGVKRFGNLVSLKGVVSATTSLPSNTTVYALPGEYRPSTTRVFNCRAYIGGAMTTVQVNLQTDGQIKPQSAFSSGQWISLEIMYFTGG